MEFKKGVSMMSSEGDPEEAIQLLREEFEILDAALAPWEITHEVIQQSDENSASTNDSSGHDVHKIQLTILPTTLEGKKLAIQVIEDNGRLIPIQFLPRLILNLNLVLDPDKIGDYPKIAAPNYQIEGYFVKKAFQIYQELEKQFTPGCPCLFNWFNFAKDELFADPDNFDEYNPSFFPKREGYDGVLTVQTTQELHKLQDELYETARLRAQSDPVRCMICFTQPDDFNELKFFKECSHAFCKECIRQHCEHIIKDGQIDKLTCPCVDDNGACKTLILEHDLRDVGLEEELVNKSTNFSISKAID